VNITKPGESTHLKALIFGPYGTGKTHFLGTAQLDERTKPAIYLDFEGGSTTLAGLDIDMFSVRTWDDFNEVYSGLAVGEGGYKSVLLDSLSETHIFALMEINESQGRDDVLQIQDYGKASIQMRRLIRLFRDLPYHVFMTAQDKTDKEARVGMVKKPALAGQMADEAPGLFDVCGYLTISQETDPKTKAVTETRSLLLKNFSQFRVKIRTGWGKEDTVPDLIDDPSIGSLLDVLGYAMPQEGQKEEDNVVQIPATGKSRRKSS
jgi:phage nucleotide-binding protein